MQGRDVAIGIVAVIVAVLLLGLLGGGMMMGPGIMGWGGYGYGFSPWWGILGMVFWALVIVGVVLLLVWLFRQGQPAGVGPGPDAARPIDILRERYARGEITKEQFDQMRHDLEGR